MQSSITPSLNILRSHLILHDNNISIHWESIHYSLSKEYLILMDISMDSFCMIPSDSYSHKLMQINVMVLLLDILD